MFFVTLTFVSVMLVDALIQLLDLRMLLIFSVVLFVALAYLKSKKPGGFPPGPKTHPFIGKKTTDY